MESKGADRTIENNNYKNNRQKPNTYRPNSNHNTKTWINNHEKTSRKRRFEQCNQYNKNDKNYQHMNGQPPSKRARYTNYQYRNNNNNNNNYRYNHHHKRMNHNNNNNNNNDRSIYYQNRNKQKKNNMGNRKAREIEEDFHRITQRMRQIDIGKNTPEYKNYIATIPKNKRESHHPRTPNPKYKMPNKHWKTAVNRWRKALHAFDLDAPQKNNDENNNHNHDNNDDNNNKENKNDNNCKSENSTPGKVNFCCEKCSDEFAKFDEWQKHRQQCNGTSTTTTKEKEKAVKDNNNDDDSDSDGFDIFDIDNLDEDIDLNFAKTTTEINTTELSNDDKHNQTNISNETVETDQDEKESSLLNALNHVLSDDDDDEDSDGFL